MTQKNKISLPEESAGSVVVSKISPHSKALYEAGKSLLVDSVKTGREFCRFMIGVATGAIPTYLALLRFAFSGKAEVLSTATVIYLIPPALFLTAAVVFVVGFFPEKSNFSLDIIEEIERERSKTISRRHRLAIMGFIVFCLGVVCAILILTLTMAATSLLPPNV